jgi:hypothetical protein
MRHHLHAFAKVDAIEGGSVMSEHGTGVQVSPRTTIKVALKENVTLEQLTKVISTIGGRYGCRACGLLGFDLQLAGDPGDFTEVAGFEGVKSVGV